MRRVPADTLGPVLHLLGRLRAVPRTTTTIAGPTAVVEGMVPAARVHHLEQRSPP